MKESARKPLPGSMPTVASVAEATELVATPSESVQDLIGHPATPSGTSGERSSDVGPVRPRQTRKR